MVWPHLLTIEFLAAGVMSIFLLMMGLFINAPLEELAVQRVLEVDVGLDVRG